MNISHVNIYGLPKNEKSLEIHLCKPDFKGLVTARLLFGSDICPCKDSNDARYIQYSKCNNCMISSRSSVRFRRTLRIIDNELKQQTNS